MIKLNNHLSHPRRGGATLVEVLMSILIMSIGIVSVATLFPIAVLRSLHATQLTHSTILRFNAESLIDLDDNIIHDPDLDGNAVTTHINENYVVDPMGYLKINPTFQGNYGNDGAAPDPTVTRYNYAITDENIAAKFFSLPDNWVRIVEAFPIASTVTSATFPAGTDFTGALINSENSRIVLIDADGRHSAVREIDSIAGNVVSWVGDVNLTIGQARIETRERMYTYLLSVRKDGVGVAQVDVIVFFRRGYSSQDEEVFGLTKLDADEFTVSWTPGSKPSLKKGDYLFDIDNGRWHRIQTITESTWTADIKIERPTTDNISNAVFPTGIVKVFPVGSKTP